MSDSTLPATSAALETRSAQPASDDLMRVMTDLQGATDAVALDRAMTDLAHLRTIDPANGMVLMGLGIGHARRQAWPEAQDCFEQAVAVAPKLAPARMNLGNLHRQHGRLELARAAYEKTIELQPGLADAHYNLSLLQDEAGETDEAEASVRRALLFKSDYPEAHNNLGHLLIKAGKVEQALSHFRQALVWAPDLLPARFNLILALYRLGRSHEAQVEVDRALQLHPDNAQVLRVQAAGLMQMGQLDEAEQVNQKLRELQPDAPDLLMNQADVLLMREDFDGAKAIYQSLLSKRLVPPAVGIGAMGNLMRAQSQFTEARTLYQQALMMDNRLPALVLGLARTLTEGGELKQGLASWRRAVQMLPRAADVHSGLIAAQRFDPDTEPEAQAQEIALWTQAHGHPAADKPSTPVRAQAIQADEDLRLGFLLGADTSGVTLASLQALQTAGNRRSSLFFYQGGAITPAERPLQQSADHWRPTGSLGLTDLAEQIRQDAIDVLIDTVGHGLGSRLPVLAQRAAPLQLAWLGDFSSPGLPGVDAVLSDAVLATGFESGIAHIEPLYHWQAPTEAPAVPAVSGDRTIFGVVSPISHINARVLDAWAEILLAEPEAELHFVSRQSQADTATRQRLVRLLMIREVAPGRIHFDIAPDNTARLEKLGRVTVVLDTFPMPMPLTTALECLWMGVPVLTLSGNQPWTRTSASALTHAGLTDWITDSPASYVARACQRVGASLVAQNWRCTVRQHLQASPIMDPARFAPAFESAINNLWSDALARNAEAS